MSGWFERLRRRFKRPRASAHLVDDDVSDEWMAVTERMRGDMVARQRALEPLAPVVSAISARLYSADPIGLAGMGSPDDEYDSEAETIVLRLSDSRHLMSEAQVLDVVHEEFVRWFGTDLAGPRERYSSPAADVYRLWGEYLAEE